MAFSVGQKVVCVTPDDNAEIVKGEVYTIHSIRSIFGKCGLVLVEINRAYGGYWAWRFRPVKTTSISCFTQMLAPRPVKTRERVQ